MLVLLSADYFDALLFGRVTSQRIRKLAPTPRSNAQEEPETRVFPKKIAKCYFHYLFENLKTLPQHNLYLFTRIMFSPKAEV
jgi:hypothetical protein